MRRHSNRKNCYIKRSGVAIILLLAAATIAMAADPWDGAWKLKPDKSKGSGGRLPHPNSTNIIKIQGDTMHLISDQSSTNGQTEHVEYTVGLDGKEYPVKTTPPWRCSHRQGWKYRMKHFLDMLCDYL
jgi:hypothetical protein